MNLRISILLVCPCHIKSFVIPPSSLNALKLRHIQQDLPVNHMINDMISMNIPPADQFLVALDAFDVATGTLVSFEQNFEAEVYADISHVILDVGSIFAPDTLLIRVLFFVGRICSILSDYVPDHSMTFDELTFQFIMLTFNTSSLLNRLATFVPYLTETTSFQDKRMFVSVFEPAGFSWVQYKTLLALKIIEWSECDPETCLVEDNECLLVTYQGWMEHLTDGTSTPKQYGGVTSSYDIIGDFSEVNKLLRDVNGNNKKRGIISKNKNSNISPGNKNQILATDGNDEDEDKIFNNSKKPRILQVGESGAVFLRINIKKLLQNTFTDKVDNTMNLYNLYFNAMEKELGSPKKHSGGDM